MYVKEVAIAGIVVLESVALVQGIDGAFLLPLACIIAGIAGYSIHGVQMAKCAKKEDKI